MRQVWNIIKYLIIFCINLLMLFFLHGYFNLLIFILMVLMPVVSILSAGYALHRISVDFAGAKENMHIQDPFFLNIILNNPTVIPLVNVSIRLCTQNPFFGLEGEHMLNVPAYAKRQNEISYPLQSEYLGVLALQAKELRVTDWLGFVVLHKKVEEKKEIVLLPFESLAVEPELTALSTGMTEMEESKTKGSDFSEVQDIREYQPGDKLQNIHWKLSAKKDELMVKERVNLSSSQLIVLVELFQNETMILNRILTAAYGMAHFLLHHQIPFSLRWWSVRDNDMKLMYVNNVGELDQWMETIYYERFYDNAGLGYTMLRQLLQEDTRFLAIGSAGSNNGEVLLQYGGDVEGYICR